MVLDLRGCPTRREEAGIYLKEPAGFLVSLSELTELRQARGKDALGRQPTNLFLAENLDRLGILAGGIVRETDVPIMPTRWIGVEPERVLGQFQGIVWLTLQNPQVAMFTIVSAWFCLISQRLLKQGLRLFQLALAEPGITPALVIMWIRSSSKGRLRRANR
jgi:hypothetical protein